MFWTKRGVAETYCTMYGHGMYDPAKHEEHCWPVATVWQWVSSFGSSYVWRWGCCFFHLGSEAFDPAWRIEDFTCSTNYGSPMWFSKKCQVICKKFPRLHGWSHCVREPKFTAALATNRIQVSVNLRWKGSGCGAGMAHGFKHLMWTWLKHPYACEKSKMGKTRTRSDKIVLGSQPRKCLESLEGIDSETPTKRCGLYPA